MRLWPHTCGALWLDFDSDDLDGKVVARVLVENFGAVFGERWEDPLGDSAYVKFTVEGLEFELDGDVWMGLQIISWSDSGDALIRRFHAYFQANPPPRRSAG